jgi:two-component sensor histidine kinase
MKGDKLRLDHQQVEREESSEVERVDTILIVDGNQTERVATVQLLRLAGYEIQAAANAAEALQAARQKPPDLIILDAALPGTEVLRKIKAAPETEPIPVLYVSTNHDHDAALVAGLDAGADSCLTKPIPPIVLRATCRSLLRLARAERLAEESLRLAEQRASEAEMGRHLAETLNAEVNHRVKNNLAMVSALLQIQSAAPGMDRKAAQVLLETAGRVAIFARIHEQLQTEAEGQIDLLQVVHQLTTMIEEMVTGKRLHLEVEGEPVLLDAETATRLAMVANELLINAAKHGGPSPSGELHIRVELEAKADKLHLSVWNSGLPRHRAEGQLAGLGLQLVRGLIAQHQGRFALKSYNGGSLAEVVVHTPQLQ